MKRVKMIAVLTAAALFAAMISGCAVTRGSDNPVNAPTFSEPVTETPEKAEIEESRAEETVEISEETPPQDDFSDMNNQVSEENVKPAGSDFLESLGVDYAQISGLSSQKETGFPGGPPDELNRPSGPLSYQQKYGKYGAYFIVPDSQKFYLTFDEGYENG